MSKGIFDSAIKSPSLRPVSYWNKILRELLEKEEFYRNREGIEVKCENDWRTFSISNTMMFENLLKIKIISCSCIF